MPRGHKVLVLPFWVILPYCLGRCADGADVPEPAAFKYKGKAAHRFRRRAARVSSEVGSLFPVLGEASRIAVANWLKGVFPDIPSVFDIDKRAAGVSTGT